MRKRSSSDTRFNRIAHIGAIQINLDHGSRLRRDIKGWTSLIRWQIANTVSVGNGRCIGGEFIQQVSVPGTKGLIASGVNGANSQLPTLPSLENDRCEPVFALYHGVQPTRTVSRNLYLFSDSKHLAKSSQYRLDGLISFEIQGAGPRVCADLGDLGACSRPNRVWSEVEKQSGATVACHPV